MTPLHEIEAMLAKCTPGEWVIASRCVHSDESNRCIVDTDASLRADVELIARAPSLLCELIDRLRKAEKVVEVAKEVRAGLAVSTESNKVLIRGPEHQEILGRISQLIFSVDALAGEKTI